jgi:hypothetical protein
MFSDVKNEGLRLNYESTPALPGLSICHQEFFESYEIFLSEYLCSMNLQDYSFGFGGISLASSWILKAFTTLSN